VGRANGLIEIGTEKLPTTKPRASSSKQQKEARRQSIKIAVERYRAGERPKRTI
jgi:hypothetical protein